MRSVPALGNREASSLLVGSIACLWVGRVEGGGGCRCKEGIDTPHSRAPLLPQLPVSSQQPGDGGVVTGAERQR